MVARITLEFDDQTSPGFQKLVKSFEQGEAAAADFAGGTQEGNKALSMMQQQQLQTVAAIEATTMAVKANADSWMAATNTVIEFARNMRDVAVAAKDTAASIADTLVDHAIRRGLISTLATVGATALGVGKYLLIAKTGMFALEKAFSSTGKKVVAVSGDVSVSAKNMAAQINAGHKTVEQVMEETGASLEELGLKAETNWSRMSDAANKSIGGIRREINNSAAAIIEATGVPQAARESWAGFDREMTRFADNFVSNMEAARESAEDFWGRSTKLRKEQEKLAEDAERKAPVNKKIQEFEEGLKRQIDLEREMYEIRQINTQKDVRAALVAARKKRNLLRDTFQFHGRAAERNLSRIKALALREEQIHREAKQRRLALVQEMEQKDKEFEEKRLARIKEANEREFQMRREAWEKQQQLQKQFEQGKKDLELQAHQHAFQLAKQKLEHMGGKEDQILEIEKMAARDRAGFALRAAKTEEDRLRIKFDLTKELRELDLKHKQLMEQKKVEAAEKAKQKEEQLEREKINQLKAQRDDKGRNAFEHVVGQQGQKKVLEQIMQDRIAKAKQANPNLGEEGQRRLERSVRQRTFRAAKQGTISQAERARAQMDLASNQVLKARKDGKLNDAQFRAMQELAKTMQDQVNHAARLEQEQQQLIRYIRAMQQQQRNHATRRRGQLP